ncbi:MAG TPA: TPM domain-containing protein [Rhodanobacteraceae bacterium]|nr:TPM domain-containing protein [Rhodanobacteraceae bacterium]
MDFMRAIRHLLHAPAGRRFPKDAMEEIQQAIAQGEKNHDAEICFAVEARLPLRSLLGGHRARARAEDLFGRLRVWDTARKTGVLIYVLLADRSIEIVADRGVAARLPGPAWNVVAEVMRKHFQQDDWRGGALAGIKAMNALLVRHLPPRPGGHPNELPDQPIVL